MNPVSRARAAAAAVAVAALMVAVGINLMPAQSAQTVVGDPGTGRAESCVLDSQGSCNVQHGFGVKPSAVTVTPSGSLGFAAAVVNPVNTTATQYRVTFWRTATSRYPAGTTMTFYAHYDFAPTATPPSTPPVSTPPTTPSATPTDTASPVKDCASPSFTTTSTNNIGDGRTYGSYFVHNNMWNNSNGRYTMAVCNYDNWYELVTQPLPGDRGVQAYPNVHKDYNDVPLSQIQAARFAASSPRCAGCIYNVAFDVWINSDFDNELMIWTENFGQRPAGTRLADTTIGGKTYQVWKSGGATSPGGIFTYVATPAQLYGTMPLNLFFADLQARGWIPPNSTTWQVDFGVEVVSTNDTQQRFDFTDFEIIEN